MSMDSFGEQFEMPPDCVKAIEEHGPLRIIRLQGAIDTAHVEQMEKHIRYYRKQRGFEFKELIMDFKNVSYADTSAIAQLIEFMSDYRKAGHRMAIIDVQEKLRCIFELRKLEKLFQFYASEADAIRALDLK